MGLHCSYLLTNKTEMYVKLHYYYNIYCYKQDALPLTEVESAFDTSVESIGNRDCRIQRVSALRGYVISGCGLQIDPAL